MTTETPETPETADPTPEEEEKSPELTNEDRYQLVSKIIGREIFIDPLDAEQITKAYSITCYCIRITWTNSSFCSTYICLHTI